jgi:hypothetical protein
MRHSAVTLIGLSALLGSIAFAVQAEDAQQSAAPKAETGAPAPGIHGAGENRKSSGTNDQSGPSSAAPTSDQHSQGDQATHSVSGRSGKEEPGSHAPSQDAAVFVDGKLNVAGAPADSQTVPAKFSERNDKLDHTPIMAMRLGLSDEQKRKIIESVKSANQPAQASNAKPADELAWDVKVHDLGASAIDPALKNLKYVRTKDRILLVDVPNRIVVGEVSATD